MRARTALHGACHVSPTVSDTSVTVTGGGWVCGIYLHPAATDGRGVGESDSAAGGGGGGGGSGGAVAGRGRGRRTALTCYPSAECTRCATGPTPESPPWFPCPSSGTRGTRPAAPPADWSAAGPVTRRTRRLTAYTNTAYNRTAQRRRITSKLTTKKAHLRCTDSEHPETLPRKNSQHTVLEQCTQYKLQHTDENISIGIRPSRSSVGRALDSR